MLTARAREQGLTPGDGVRDGCLKDNKVPFSEEGATMPGTENRATHYCYVDPTAASLASQMGCH